MKKILFLLAVAVFSQTLASCSDDEWGNGDPAMEHIYYVGFEDWATYKNDVVFEVVHGQSFTIPVQYHSERVRSYDVVTYYYVGGDLMRGVDYEVTDSNGTPINPDSNGAFTMNWAQAKKGIQNVHIKILDGSDGSFHVYTFNPNAGKIEHPDNITNSKTNDYEVRSFTQNYMVTVKVK